ncbi:hypothetical protein P872_14290 [Rhodonellum psychrophilum GCM71 = DSM 17998]|uniref:DinB-like domain-containing protein n=2 Tax=Rhodonellum TaxID=336827 RepID=U5BW88_9BACT|nr:MULTISPECIES: DinB family protein [Rhodonellum]ERM80207.1 hypothetical protein P872_14290 [Rhodonellum psychrophilum GCM71 = DSM 17998]SDZ22611.1 DinB superfamily protein [Rhodonellum ikkaensis]
MKKQPEVWLRGNIEGYPRLLQPVVHAILQAHEEIHELIREFPSDLLWEKPFGMASVAFHLQHIPGVMDRMATYAKGETLSGQQLGYLQKEGKPDLEFTSQTLLRDLDLQIVEFLHLIAQINTDTLTDPRGVGRAQLPSTVGGLLFHAAEHAQRHLGQLLVTVRILTHKAE